MTRADRTSVAGQRYLDLQRKARQTARPTDELIQLYALECFLDRLVRSRYAERLILKGGVLLAALDARRPTRDIDLAATALENTAVDVLSVVREIANIACNDGVEFDLSDSVAEVIREEDAYSGVRVTLSGTLSRAVIRLHVDVNVGDPIWPEPQSVQLPRILDGKISLRGYPLEMVLAEKIATAMVRGTANTRWRDFADIYSLVRRHPIDGTSMRTSLEKVANYRKHALTPLASALTDYPEIAQPRWAAWLRKQQLDATIPTQLTSVIGVAIAFTDPILTAEFSRTKWDPALGRWSDPT